MKEEILWEENHSTELKMNNDNSIMNVECDTTGSMLTTKDEKDLKDITNKKVSGIYKIVNKMNGKYYVGSSINLSKRWTSHKKLLKINRHPNIHLQRAWNKYKKENFMFEVLEECLPEKCIGMEQYYLDLLKPEYNICLIAGSSFGRKASPETRLKMSLQRRGVKRIPCSEERKQKQRRTLKERYKNGLKHPLQGTHHSAGSSNPMYGKHHSDEVRQKISDALKGNHLSQKTKENLSFIHRDKNVYTLINIQSYEVFSGTKQDFIRLYNNGKRCYPIYQMFKGIRTYHGWKLKSFPINN